MRVWGKKGIVTARSTQSRKKPTSNSPTPRHQTTSESVTRASLCPSTTRVKISCWLRDLCLLSIPLFLPPTSTSFLSTNSLPSTVSNHTFPTTTPTTTSSTTTQQTIPTISLHSTTSHPTITQQLRKSLPHLWSETPCLPLHPPQATQLNPSFSILKTLRLILRLFQLSPKKTVC